MSAAMMAAGGMLMITAQARSVPVQTRVAVHVLASWTGAAAALTSPEPADREAVKIVLASRYRSVLADPSLYAPERFLMLTPAHKTLADRIRAGTSIRDRSTPPRRGPPSAACSRTVCVSICRRFRCWS